MAFRDEAREQEPAEFQNSDSSRRDTAIALHLGRYIIRPRGRISYAAAYIMQRSCISLRSPASPSPHFTCVSSFSCSKRQFHCAALPCFVPGFRLVPLKIAASGARALLAMTNLVGLAGKWGSFRNEIFENRYEATPRKNDRIQQNASVFQIKTLQLCVIARPPCGRGNLKAKGMASRYEAR